MATNEQIKQALTDIKTLDEDGILETTKLLISHVGSNKRTMSYSNFAILLSALVERLHFLVNKHEMSADTNNLLSTLQTLQKQIESLIYTDINNGVQ